MKMLNTDLKSFACGATVAGALMLSVFTPAHAADLGGSIKDAPIYQDEPRRFSWSGFYMGANLGGAWATGDATYSQNNVDLLAGKLDNSSVIGGGQIGYNWQSGSLVVGIEADIAAQNLSSSTSTAVGDLTLSREGRWIGTVRPRIGYATGNALIYATGGLAYGTVEHNVTENAGIALRGYGESETRVGWTAGAGIEWALGRHWSIGAEYLHIDLGKTTVSSAASTVGGVLFPASAGRFEDREDVIRAKLNYKF